MKKYLCLMLLCLFNVSLIFAQAIVSQNFGSGLNGWTSIDHNTNVGKWVYSHNPIVSPSFGDLTLKSTTASNGFALIMSDGVTSAINTDLVSPAINCTGHNYVGIEFSQWIQVYSAATATVSVSTDNVNWTLVYDVANSSYGYNPELIQLDISSIAANQPTVYIKFNYQANNDLFWAIDDINILALPALDASVTSVDVQDYIAMGNNTIQATVQNMGGSNLHSLTLSYSINDSISESETFNGFTLAPFQSQSFQFSAPYTLTSASNNSIKVISSAPNSSVDGNSTNDTAVKQCVSLSHVPDKNVLIEEFTTVPCGYCPGGKTDVDRIMQTESSYTIPVCIHAGFGTDAMTTSQDNSLANAFSPGQSPTANIDRILYQGNDMVAVGIPDLSSTYNPWKDDDIARHSILPPLSISASNTYDSASRVLNVTINTTFYGPASGNFRVNCYVIEDSVTGTGSGYSQHSYYYSYPTNTTLNPWYHVGTTNLGSGTWSINNYVHRYVARNMLGGTWGNNGVIPLTAVTDSTYSKTYTYTLPSGLNAKHISLVPFVCVYNSNYTSGDNEIYNCLSMPLNSSDSTAAAPVIINSIQEQASVPYQVLLYPNPAKDMVYLSYTLPGNAHMGFDVYNMQGQLVSHTAESNYNKGNYSTFINTSGYSNGLYLVTIKEDGRNVQTLKFVVEK